MKFKIGDKVKVCDSSRWKKRIKDTIGVVMEIHMDVILVKWRTKGCVVCGIGCPCRYPTNVLWHKLYDIELTIKPGQQLLFSFMG